MAKKSTAARSSGAGRRPQTTTKNASAKNASRQAMLVRTPEMVAAGTASATPAEATTTQTRQTGAANASRPATASTTSAPRVATPKAATPASPAPKVAARPTAATATRSTHANRAARAQAVQRARAVNLISAEHYAYVVNDLKLTAVLAAAMFLVIIVLHFVLG